MSDLTERAYKVVDQNIRKYEAERLAELDAQDRRVTAAWSLVLSWMAQANRASSRAETAGAEEDIRCDVALRREAQTASAHAAELRLILES